MQTWTILILIFCFIVFEFFLFYHFYSRKSGRVAVYNAWYAWIIDTLAMFSGVSIMGLSLICLYNPWIFNISVPSFLFIVLFIFGSWQFGIHFVKLIIRSTKNILKKIKTKNARDESLEEFREEYEKARDDFFEDIKDDGQRNDSLKK